MVVSFANVNGLCFLAENVNVKIDDDDLTELLTAPYCCVIEGRQAVNEGEGAFRLVCGDKPSQAAPCSFFIFLLLGGKVLPFLLERSTSRRSAPTARQFQIVHTGSRRRHR